MAGRWKVVSDVGVVLSSSSAAAVGKEDATAEIEMTASSTSER
jgi:hypothetical protein